MASRTMTQPLVLSATTMIGTTVCDVERGKLGTIEEVMPCWREAG